MTKIIREFKGGSLSSTNLIEKDGELLVRKSVSLKENRIYGFQRWYSQLKKLQRFSIMFPGMFPDVIDYGTYNSEAFFDMEFFEDSFNAQEYIYECKSKEKIDIFFNSLISSINRLHNQKFSSTSSSIDLYIHEEIDQRLEDCQKDKAFIDFLSNKEILFNSQKIISFNASKNIYRDMLKKSYKENYETFTHGNMTLENILYIPSSDKVVFIDPYEENCIDSELAEYSQLLQSSNSKYEIYNSHTASVKGTKINLEIEDSFGLSYFNEILLKHIKAKYNYDQYMTIRLLEISQFIRMLPFKMSVDNSKMIFFYGLASFLLHKLREDV